VESDTASWFLRRVKAVRPTKDDFVSWFDEGIDSERHRESCEEHCEYRGVSVNRIDGFNEGRILEKFRRTLQFSPAMPKYYCKFKFTIWAGIVRATPRPDNESHFTFFRSDQFGLDTLYMRPKKAQRI
jgi:hypothetical protein